MSEAPLWADLGAFGIGVAISPLHIAVLLLLLIGPTPLRRGGIYLLGWMVTTLLALVALLTLGHGLVLDMTHGSHPRTGLDLIAGGALLTIGIREWISAALGSDEPPGWTRSVDRFAAMPLPALLSLSALIEVITPDDLLLFAKSSAALLVATLSPLQEVIGILAFTIGASLLLLLPFLAVLIGQERILPLLQRCKELLYNNGELVLGGVSITLGSYLSWQGITGLIRI